MSEAEHLIENYIHAMALGKDSEEIAEMYKDQLRDTGMSPVTMWEIAQHVVYSLYDGFFPDFPDLPEGVKKFDWDEPEIIRCKDCKYFIDHRCYHWKSLDNWKKENDFCSSAERKSDE